MKIFATHNPRHKIDESIFQRRMTPKEYQYNEKSSTELFIPC